jgi:hypothetical protein
MSAGSLEVNTTSPEFAEHELERSSTHYDASRNQDVKASASAESLPADDRAELVDLLCEMKALNRFAKMVSRGSLHGTKQIRTLGRISTGFTTR